MDGEHHHVDHDHEGEADPDELHGKLGAVAHGLADLLQIPRSVISASCEDGGEIIMPLSVAEVLLLRAVHAENALAMFRAVRLSKYLEGPDDDEAAAAISRDVPNAPPVSPTEDEGVTIAPR